MFIHVKTKGFPYWDYDVIDLKTFFPIRGIQWCLTIGTLGIYKKCEGNLNDKDWFYHGYEYKIGSVKIVHKTEVELLYLAIQEK